MSGSHPSGHSAKPNKESQNEELAEDLLTGQYLEGLPPWVFVLGTIYVTCLVSLFYSMPQVMHHVRPLTCLRSLLTQNFKMPAKQL